MLSKYQITKIDISEFFEELLNFNKEHKQRFWQTDKDILKWRLLDAAKSETTAPIVYAVINKNNKIKGTLIGMPAGGYIDKNFIKITWPVDFFLSPELRGLGLGKKLIVNFVNEMSNVIGIGGTPAALSLYNKLSWPIRQEIKSYKKVLHPLRFYRKSNSTIKSKIDSAVNYLKDLKPKNRIQKIENNFIFKQVSQFTIEMERLIQENRLTDTVVCARETDKVKWLCSETPAGEYYFFTVELQNTIIGYFILKIKNLTSGIIEGLIIDIYCKNLDFTAMKAAVSYATIWLSSRGVDIIRTMAASPVLKSVYRELNYLESSGPSLIHMSKLPYDTEQKNWHITMLDSDYSYR